jgi:hypothetical protein
VFERHTVAARACYGIEEGVVLPHDGLRTLECRLRFVVTAMRLVIE